MPRIVVRPLQTRREFLACERLQKVTWGGVGTSAEVLQVAAKYGGAVLGAFVNGRQRGFLFAILARRDGRLIHWSHLMAVEPGWRSHGLGFRMKLAHRKLALAAGIRSICWTFDPLQGRNAALNVARLGATVEEYLPNCYGQFGGRIEKDLPSDRFVVNWRIATPEVARRLRARHRSLPDLSLPRANETRTSRQGFLENARLRLDLRSPKLLVEIPPNTDAMRERAPALARRWRFDTRRLFLKYFAAGYRVRDFIPPADATGRKCFYVLERRK
jgi:predicted GNAT superfamily acetyltransferase